MNLEKAIILKYRERDRDKMEFILKVPSSRIQTTPFYDETMQKYHKKKICPKQLSLLLFTTKRTVLT